MSDLRFMFQLKNMKAMKWSAWCTKWSGQSLWRSLKVVEAMHDLFICLFCGRSCSPGCPSKKCWFVWFVAPARFNLIPRFVFDLRIVNVEQFNQCVSFAAQLVRSRPFRRSACFSVLHAVSSWWWEVTKCFHAARLETRTKEFNILCKFPGG